MAANVTLDESCVLKSARSTLVMITISKMGEIIHCEPSENELEDENFNLDFTIVFASKETDENIMEMVSKI